MATNSVIGVAELEGQRRIDAEYYQPAYLEMAARLDATRALSLVEIGAVLDCSAFYPAVAPLYGKEGVPFLRIEDLRDAVVRIDSDSVFLPEWVLAENKATITDCRPGDILIAKGGNTIAKVGIVTDDYAAYAVCRDLIVVRTGALRGTRTEVLLAYLMSRHGQAMMVRTASQTGQPHLTIGSISQLQVPNVSPLLGTYVARALRTAVDLRRSAVAAYRAARAEVDAQVHASLPDSPLFTTSYAALRRSGRIDAEHYRPSLEVLRQQVRNCGDYASLASLGRPSVETCDPHAEPDSMIRYVELADVDAEIGILRGTTTIAGGEAPGRARMKLKSGQVLVASVAGSVEKVALVGAEMDGAVGSTGFHVLEPSGIEPEYLLLVAHSDLAARQMEAEASGTILSAVAVANLSQVVVPVLSEHVRARLSSAVRTAHAEHFSARSWISLATGAIDAAIEEGETEALALFE